MNDDIRGVLGAVLPPVEPPNRHTPEQLLTAGRRARRVRRIGLASAAAAVVALGLVTAMVLPGAIRGGGADAADGPRTGADYPAIGNDQYRSDTTGTLSKRLRAAHANAAPHIAVQPHTWTDAKGEQVVDDLPLELTAQMDDATPTYFTSGDIAEKNANEKLNVTLYPSGKWKDSPGGNDSANAADYLLWCDDVIPVAKAEAAATVDPDFGTCAKLKGPEGSTVYVSGNDMVGKVGIDATSFTVVLFRTNHTAVSISNRCGTFDEKFTKPTCPIDDLTYSVAQLTDIAINAPNIPNVKQR